MSWIALLSTGVQYCLIALIALITILLFAALCIVVFRHVRIKYKDTVIEAPVEPIVDNTINKVDNKTI